MTEGSGDLPKRGACPDAELIAAHAERRLVGDEAARMDAHLASCPTCPELFAEAVRFVEEEELALVPARAVAAPERGASALRGQRKPIRLAAALAAAAAVIFAFQFWRNGFNPPQPGGRVASATPTATPDHSPPQAEGARTAEPEERTLTRTEPKRGRTSAAHAAAAESASPPAGPGENAIDAPGPTLEEPGALPRQAEALPGAASHPSLRAAIAPARAQGEVRTRVEETTESGRRAEEVTVVSASRIEQRVVDAPATMSVITSEALETTPAQNVADVIRSVPGLNVIQTSARDFNLTARQATSTLASSTLVTVDGRSVYLDFLGFVLWDFVPSPASGEIEQIEIVRGPASVVWGANAVNGLVNFITKRPREGEGFGLVLGAGLFDRDGGSREADGDGHQLNGSFSFAHVPNDAWSYKLNAGYYFSDPYSRPLGTVPLDCHPLGVVPCRDANLQALPGGIPIGGAAYPADANQPGAFENHGTSQPKLDVRVDQDFSNGGRISYVGGYGGTQGIIHTGIGPFDLENGSYMAYGRVAYRKDALQVAGSLNLVDAQASNLLLSDPTTLEPILLAFKTQTYDLEFGNTNVVAQHHIFTYGGNLRRNNFDISLAQGPDRTEYGGYLHWEYFVNKFRFAAGGRVDKFGNISNAVFSPRVSVMFKPAPNLSIRASYNKAFVAPSFINNYLSQNIQSPQAIDLSPLEPLIGPAAALVPPPFFPTVNAYGNPAIKEQSTDAWELAYTGTFGGKTTVGLAAYTSDSDNNINFTNLYPPGTPGYPPPTYYSVTNPAKGVTVPTETTPAQPITLSPILMGILANIPPQLGGPIRIPYQASTYLNLGPIRNRGIEATIDQRFNKMWSAFANYSWQDTPEILRVSSDEIPYPASQIGIPAKHRFNAGLAYNGSLLFANANVNYAGRALWVDVLDGSYAGFTDQYAMLNAAVGVKLVGGKLVVSVRGTNLANESIQQHIFGDVLKRSIVFEMRILPK